MPLPRCWAWDGCSIDGPPGSREANASAWRWAGRWFVSRVSCCWMSRSRTSMIRSAQALRGELVELHRRFGSTIVHVTHDQSEALSIGQRLAVVHEGRIMQVDTPGGIYERPMHRFVASFVGSPGMNLVACEVVLGETTLQIRHPGGNEITYPVSVHPQDTVLPLYEPVRLELGIRAEWVIISGEALVGPENPRYPFVVLPTIVRAVEFQGASWLVTLQVDGQTLLARTPPRRVPREGQRVVAHLELSRASWFDPSTGRRLELHCQLSPNAIA